MFRSHYTDLEKLSFVFLGALTFDMEYARWQDDHNKQINELRAALNAHASDDDLRHIIDSIMAHYREAFRLKGVAAKADAFHVLSGMWKTPVERCFMWLGGLRPSEILKVYDLPHLLLLLSELLSKLKDFSGFFLRSCLQAIWNPLLNSSLQVYTACNSPRNKLKRIFHRGSEHCNSRSQKPLRQDPCILLVLLVTLQIARGRWQRQ
jgi:hypothetical protein